MTTPTLHEALARDYFTVRWPNLDFEYHAETADKAREFATRTLSLLRNYTPNEAVLSAAYRRAFNVGRIAIDHETLRAVFAAIIDTAIQETKG